MNEDLKQSLLQEFHFSIPTHIHNPWSGKGRESYTESQVRESFFHIKLRMFINYTRRNNLEHIQTVKLFLKAQLSFYAGKAEMWRHSNCSGIVTQLTDR